MQYRHTRCYSLISKTYSKQFNKETYFNYINHRNLASSSSTKSIAKDVLNDPKAINKSLNKHSTIEFIEPINNNKLYDNISSIDTSETYNKINCVHTTNTIEQDINQNYNTDTNSKINQRKRNRHINFNAKKQSQNIKQHKTYIRNVLRRWIEDNNGKNIVFGDILKFLATISDKDGIRIIKHDVPSSLNHLLPSYTVCNQIYNYTTILTIILYFFFFF